MSFSDFDWWVRAQDSIGQGALTNSKHPDSHVFGVYPTHISGGNLAHVFDAKGKRYVDYICALGTNLFGYANPQFMEVLERNLYKGFSHSLPTHDEVLAAEALKTMFVFTDKWKFLKSGSQACTAAIKMARAYTGRLTVLSEGYHGHEDEFVSLTTPARGVHTCTDIRPYSDAADLTDVAAVIIEPVISIYDEKRKAWLQDLRERCTKAGTILIFDEVITGFRFDKHSVAQATNILPDLIIIGKAMALGLPLAAVGGRKEILDADYFVSSTYAGEVLSLIACREVVNALLNKPSYRIAKLWEAGEEFKTKFNTMAAPYLKIEGYPTRGVFVGSDLNKALFFQEACRSGFLFCNSWFYNFALPDYDHLFFTFLKDFLDRLKLSNVTLEGRMPKSPFAQRLRDAANRAS